MRIKLNNTDPTYLRTIHDGLLSGTIHKVNASTLPIGLIGIYEEALPPSSNANVRKKLIEFFAVWALLKKEVSLAFVVPLLEGWTEEHVLDYISKYSKWFNSPVSGKYVLYHERFRTFVIQKISQGHFTACNEAIIQNCQAALQAKSGDELEQYALEHLSLHLLIQAMESKDSAALKTLAYGTAHWNRQVEISKGFEWSKRMLNDMMLWASKYDDDEVIECALNKVDLHHQEQNDAPRIVELVKQNDIETALQRIEAFGGNDKEGLQRKFILYMLCLMELTLLESKDKPFRKQAIDKLLKHLDENLPVDHSVLNWDDFFPSYLMFLMACEWAEMGLDSTIVYKRTESWEYDWIKEKGPYSEIQLQVIADNAEDIRAYPTISEVLTRNGYFSASLEFARCIDEVEKKCKAIAFISSELHFIGKNEEASSIMFEALSMANEIPTNSLRCYALSSISLEMTKQGRLQDAMNCISNINISYVKDSALKDISLDLAIQGRLKEAYICAIKIPDEFYKSEALTAIAAKLANLGQMGESETVIKESLAFARSILDEGDKIRAIMDIAVELAKQCQTVASKSVMEEALACGSFINYEFMENLALKEIIIGLAKLGQLEKALTFANKISDDEEKVSALNTIIVELTKHGRLEDALALSLKLDDERERDNSLMDIVVELSKLGRQKDSLYIAKYFSDQFLKITALMAFGAKPTNLGLLQQVTTYLQDVLAITHSLIDEEKKNTTLKAIAVEFAKQAQIIKSLLTANQIRSPLIKDSALIGISILLAKQRHSEQSLSCTQEIVDLSNRIKALTAVSSLLFKQSQKKQSLELLNESLSIALIINDKIDKYYSLNIIAAELFKQDQIEKAETVMQVALENARGISDEYLKGFALRAISTELAKQGQVEEALACARGISDDYWQSSALKDISTELAKQGNVGEALTCARGISSAYWKSRALAAISTEQAKQGKVEEAALAMQEAITCGRGISDESEKSNALKDISTELAKQGKADEALANAEGISDKSDKSRALKDISTELGIQGKVEEAAAAMQEALTCARGISDDYYNKSSVLKDISTESSKQGNWVLAEATGLEIPKIATRHNCWKEIAKDTSKEKGCLISLELSNKFSNPEAKIYFLKGLADSIKSINTNKELIFKIRYYYQDDIESMEKLLQNHALHELFFSDAPSEKIERFNKTLNIQWAIDIKNSFSAN